MRCPRHVPIWLASAAALAIASGLCMCTIGCEGDSAETLVRNIEFLISGIYRNRGDSNNGKLVSNNTGSPVTQLNVRQTGDQLEAIDNNGLIFKGTIGNASDTEGSFTLEGQTTAGQPATISGVIRKSSGSSTEAEMRGTWIEPSLFGTVVGVASVPPNRSGGGSTNGTDTNTNNASVGFIRLRWDRDLRGAAELAWRAGGDGAALNALLLTLLLYGPAIRRWRRNRIAVAAAA
jgi:hypothetical protein